MSSCHQILFTTVSTRVRKRRLVDQYSFVCRMTSKLKNNENINTISVEHKNPMKQ